MSEPLHILTWANDIGENLALILAAGFVLGHLLPWGNRQKPLTRSLMLGSVFSVLAFISMTNTLQPLPGLRVDTRLAPVILAGALAGWPAALVAGVSGALYRLFLGGPVVVPAIGAILGAAVLGTIFGRRRCAQAPMRLRELAALGMANVAQMIFWLLLAELWLSGVTGLTAAVLPAEFAALLLLGLIISDQQRREAYRVALAKSEQRLQHAIEASSDAVFEVDYVGSREYLSPQFNAMLDYAPDIPLRFDDLIHPEDREREKQLAGDHFALRTPHYEAEVRLRAADGRWVWCALRGQVVQRDAQQRPELWTGTITDITERKTFELKMRHERDRAQTYLDVAAVMLIAIRPDGRVTLANRRAAQVIGCAVEQIVGKNWFDHFLPADSREGTRDVFQRIVNGTLAPFERVEGEISTISGSRRTIEWHNALLYDPQGNISGTISSGLDVTDRKAAEKALRASEARYRSLVETQEELILRMTPDGRITFANDVYCRMVRQPRTSILGQAYDPRAHPGDAEAARRVTHRVFKAPYRVQAEHRVRAHDDWRWIAWESSAIRDANGHITEVQLVGRDITQRKTAEGEARERLLQLAQVARLNTIGEMAATFAHELNQPLTAIINYAGAANHHVEREAGMIPALGQLREMMEQIIKQAERASELVYRVRHYVTRPNGMPTTANLNDVVRQAIDFVQSEARRVGAAIRMDLPDDLPSVVFDRVQIEQVVVNLLLNAIDAMAGRPGEAHCLTVSTSHTSKDKRITLTVADTGPGIAAEDLERVFEPFMTTKGKGMGLGLSIGRSIMHAAGGRLWAEARPGGGFFAFSIPTDRTAPRFVVTAARPTEPAAAGTASTDRNTPRRTRESSNPPVAFEAPGSRPAG